MEMIDTVVVDYGGVLTNPLTETFTAFASKIDLDVAAMNAAFVSATKRHGASPMAALETAQITEREMVDLVLAEIPGEDRAAIDHALSHRSFGELWFEGRVVNQPFLDFLYGLRDLGYRLALLTNNVLEWEPRWRAQVPVDDLFELVVNSAHEGVRKPDARIFQVLLDRLVTWPQRCLFVDDTPENLDAARDLGMHTVLFTDTDTTARQIRERLGLALERR